MSEASRRATTPTPAQGSAPQARVPTGPATSPVAGPATPSRRGLLAALAPAAAILATAGAASLPDIPDPSSPATVEGAARLEVVPYGPEIAQGIGTFEDWRAETAGHYAALAMMVQVLQKDHRQLADLARAESDAVLELHGFLWEVGDYYKAQAALLQQAGARLLVGASRYVMEGGAA